MQRPDGFGQDLASECQIGGLLLALLNATYSSISRLFIFLPIYLASPLYPLQTVSYITGLFHAEKAELVLVIAPVSVLPVWEAEFKKWAPEVSTCGV